MNDVTGLRKRYRDYPNISRFIDALLARGSYGLLERIASATQSDIDAMGMTLKDFDDLARTLLPNAVQK